MNPVFSPTGNLTWLQMKRDGYEADKNDIIVRFKGMDINLTANWDGILVINLGYHFYLYHI
jgi:hypothetical protein